FIEKGLYDKWKSLLISALEKAYLVQREQVIGKQVYEYLVCFCKTELASQEDQLMKLSSGLSSGLSLNDFNSNDFRVMLWQLVVSVSVERFDSKQGMAKYVCILRW